MSNFTNIKYLTWSFSGSDVVGNSHVTTTEVSSGLGVKVARSGCEQVMDGGLFAARLIFFITFNI